MLTGSGKHPLDAKGRVVVPKQLRSQLGERVYLTRGPDGCVWLFPDDEWRTFVDVISRRQTDANGLALSRFFLGTSHEARFDQMGRVPIPAMLREWANLTGDVVLAGVGNRVEIWSAEKWESLMSEMTPEHIHTLGLKYSSPHYPRNR